MDSEDIREHVICAICMEIFGDPRCLSCGHMFCRPCLNRIQHSTSIVCPVCRQKTNLSVGKTNALPKVHAIANLADSMRCKTACQTHDKIMNLFCEDCTLMICGECLKTHVRHKVADIDSTYLEAKRSMDRLLDEAESTESLVKEKVINCGRVITVLENDKTDSEKAIRTYFDRLQEQIESKKRGMVIKVQQVFDSQVGGYREEKSTLSDFQTTFQDVQREYGSISSSDKPAFIKRITVLNQRLTGSLTKVRNLPKNTSYEVSSAKYYPCKQNISEFLDDVQIHRDNEKEHCHICGSKKRKLNRDSKETFGEIQQRNFAEHTTGNQEGNQKPNDVENRRKKKIREQTKSGENPLAFLRTNPTFQRMRTVTEDKYPQLLQALLLQASKINMRLILQNEELFMQMLNEPAEGEQEGQAQGRGAQKD